MKKYTAAPLPFQGQKRQMVTPFTEALQGGPRFDTILDLFGGSGLLSHAAKLAQPWARVLWNDFDNYAQRLASIPATNAILGELRSVVAGTPRKSRIDNVTKAQIITLLNNYELAGYVDIDTLAVGLMFPGHALDKKEGEEPIDALARGTFYNHVRLSDFSAEGYLEGVTRVREDYRATASRAVGRTLLVLDPPYLSTNVARYLASEYWRLTDYLNVMSICDGVDCVLFSSSRSEIIELLTWFAGEAPCFDNPLEGAKLIEKQMKMPHAGGGYRDQMYINFR